MNFTDRLLFSEGAFPGQGFLILHKRSLLIFSTILVGVTVGVISAHQHLLMVVAVAAILFALGAFLYPDSATLVFMFLLVTNATVIAVKFHGVPYVVGASLPGMLIIPLISHMFLKKQKLIIDPIFILLLIFLIIQLLSTLTSLYPKVAISEMFTFITQWLAIHFLVVNTVRTSRMLRWVVWVIIVAGMVLGSVPLFQQVTGTFNNQYGGFAQTGDSSFGTGEETLLGEVRQPRLSGAIGEKNYYAQIMLMLVPLGLFRFWGEQSLIMRLFGLMGTALAGVGMVLAFSRGAAVGFVMMIVILLFLRLIKPYQVALFIVVVAMVGVSMPQYAQRLISLQDLTSFFSDGADTAQVDSSMSSRATEMLAAFNVFVDHPILGVGPGQFKYYSKKYGDALDISVLEGTREAHSLYLDIAAEFGFLGLTVFMAMLLLTLYRLYQVRLTKPGMANMATTFILVIVSYMATGIFLHMAYTRYFALMLALATAITVIASAEPQNEKHALLLDALSSEGQASPQAQSERQEGSL